MPNLVKEEVMRLRRHEKNIRKRAHRTARSSLVGLAEAWPVYERKKVAEINEMLAEQFDGMENSSEHIAELEETKLAKVKALDLLRAEMKELAKLGQPDIIKDTQGVQKKVDNMLSRLRPN